MQPNRYKDSKDIVKTLRAVHAAGELDETQQLLFAPMRPEEELYDLVNDPWEINNLAADPAYQERLAGFRQRLDEWMERTNDQGPESEAMYDSDMAIYTDPERRDSEQVAILKRNIALNKRWAAEGK